MRSKQTTNLCSPCHRIAPIFDFKLFLVFYPIQSIKTPPKRSYAKIEKDDDTATTTTTTQEEEKAERRRRIDKNFAFG